MKLNSSKLGTIGSGLSVACVIHCMAFPLLITLLPAVGLGFVLTGWWEVGVLWAAIIISGLSLCWGFIVHRKIRVFAFWIAAALWFTLAFQSSNHVFCMTVGGVSLCVANVMNRKLCGSCHSCQKPNSH